ncbi:NAD(P)-binding domain-containing protein [Novipirellula sp. SH528]|uniref:NAD(P)-binding domain-containing protein n=1 Tax=Novipirellula sp. SH528 TaxID=3454466 RepID=UPI003FA05434
MTALKSDRQKSSYFATVPPQEILPIVNHRFESSVKGILVIGDVTGLPLVKVAANQGAQVIANMKFDDASRANADRAADDSQLDLVIIGAGPAGLSAAMEARQRGLRYVVLERNKIASTVRGFPPGKKVYAEPQFVRNQSQLDFDEDLDKDEFLDRVTRLVSEKQLHIKEDTEVGRVRKISEGRFQVETKSGKSFPTRYVLIAVGRQGESRLLQCPGADDANKVTYRLHSPDDYHDADVMVVGGGNSAIEAALLLMPHNRVTLSYRGDDLFRAKQENRELIQQAERDGRVKILYKSNLTAIRKSELDIDVDGTSHTLPNDNVVVQIGTLPPVDFLMDMGLELDGVWTAKRVAMSIVGLCMGVFVYFYSKHFVLRPEVAGAGKLLLPGLESLAGSPQLDFLLFLAKSVLPIAWLVLLAIQLINGNMQARGHAALVPLRHATSWLVIGGLLYAFSWVAPVVFTLDPSLAGEGPYFVPGFTWIYQVIPKYFSNAYGLYYLLYFSAIAGFGLYWAVKANHRLVWRRNLTIIATQWTLWWGIPTFLAVFLGRNPWTPLLTRSLNAWPLNMGAFNIDPVVGPGDPAWWHTVAIVGVVWAAVLTFIVIPLVTIRWGKIYCSYICSCGALAETVGNGFRHRGPKGALPRKFERMGFVFIALASLATIADLYGFQGPLGYYNVWVGTALAGAVASGLYPFLGQRVWCRMWCPLAFWMNFWGRWSQFKITPEKGKCIDCNVCNQYCQMGIDIKSSALKGEPITLKDSPCVGCNECIVRCPMEILHLGDVPASKSGPRSLPVINKPNPTSQTSQPAA